MSTMRRRPYVTTRTHEVFAIAHDLADWLGHDDVTPVHVSLGLVREGRSIAAQILHGRGVPLDVVERELEAHLPPPGEPRAAARERSWTHTDESVLEQAHCRGARVRRRVRWVRTRAAGIPPQHDECARSSTRSARRRFR